MDCFKNQGFENEGFENQWFLKEGFEVEIKGSKQAKQASPGKWFIYISICIHTNILPFGRGIRMC